MELEDLRNFIKWGKASASFSAP